MDRFRKLFTWFFLYLSAAAFPAGAQSLTTIRDTVKNADGSNFYGQAIVSWLGFTAGTGATIAPHSTSITIINGYLSVVLVPTTNASSGAYYTVQYESNDGTVLWTEYWQVAPSWTPLTLNQVRVSAPPAGSGSGSSGGSTGTFSLPITESNVTNLLSDLAARPTRGSVVTNSRVAMFDALGNIGSVFGNASDCVHVDGTSGACGSTGATTLNTGFVDNEFPAGNANGSNLTFTLSQSPSPTLSLSLYRNGISLRQGVDYSLSGSTITFIAAATPQSGDILTAFYRVAGSSSTVSFADAEVPAGSIDGVNAAFTLVASPNPVASLQLYKNGVLLNPGTDYIVSGANLTFLGNALPHSGDKVQVFYRH